MMGEGGAAGPGGESGVFFFMGEGIQQDLEADQDHQGHHRAIEGDGGPGPQDDGQVHDDDPLVGLDEEGGKGHPQVFLLADKMDQKRDSVTREKGEERRYQASQRRELFPEYGEDEHTVTESEHPEMHHEENDHEGPLGFLDRLIIEPHG